MKEECSRLGAEVDRCRLKNKEVHASHSSDLTSLWNNIVHEGDYFKTRVEGGGGYGVVKESGEACAVSRNPGFWVRRRTSIGERFNSYTSISRFLDNHLHMTL